MVYVIISGWTDPARPKSMCPPATYFNTRKANGSLRLINSKPDSKRYHNTFSVSRGISANIMDADFCPPSRVRQSRSSILDMIASKTPVHFPPSNSKANNKNVIRSPDDVRRSVTRSCTSLSSTVMNSPSPLLRHASISAQEAGNYPKSTNAFPVHCAPQSRHKKGEQAVPPPPDSEYENAESSASERDSSVIRVVHVDNSKKPPKMSKSSANNLPHKGNLIKGGASFHLPYLNGQTPKSVARRSQSWIWKEPEHSVNSPHLDASGSIRETVIKEPHASPAASFTTNNYHVPVGYSARVPNESSIDYDMRPEDHTNDDPWFGSGVGLEEHVTQSPVQTLACSNSTSDFVALSEQSTSIKDQSTSINMSNAMVNDYDAETMRRAAARNREVSRKLFQQMQQKQNQHDRQASNNSEEGCDSPSTRRPLSKTPSQISSTCASSSNTDTSSSSSSSGIGSMSKGNNLYASLRQYHSSQRQSLRIVRSSSSENCTEEASWNTPQQRRSILSMIEHTQNSSINHCSKELPNEDNVEINGNVSAELANDSTSIAHSDVGAESCAKINNTTEPNDVSQPSRTTSSVAANRGVYRKISSRKRAAKEHRQSPTVACPTPILLETPDLDERRLSNDSGVAHSIPNSPDSQLSTSFTCNNTPIGASNSIASVYAVPVKLGRSSQSLDNMLTAESLLEHSNSHYKTPPPPLPRKPPPPLEDMSRPLAQSPRFTNSTPCLYENLPLTMEPPTPTPRQCPPKPPRGFITSQDTPPPTKPTVQVHPMCQQSSTPPVYENDWNCSYLDAPMKIMHSGYEHTPNERTVSPRPPVPKKPQFLATPHKQAGFAAAVQRVAPEPAPRLRKAEKVSEPCPRQLQLSTVEDNCDRLSAFVSEQDERLRGILLSQPLSSRVCLSEVQCTSNQLTLHIDSHQNNVNICSISPNSSYHTTSAGKAKLLVGLYSQPSNPDLSQPNANELETKKNELVSSLSRKLKILEEEQSLLEKEMSVNDELGEQVAQWLHDSNATPQQNDKFRLHVEETGTITCLMLKLAGQLARVENAIINLQPNATKKEKEVLTDRRRRVLSQLDDARSLQKSLDKRGQLVADFLEDLLSRDQLDDYSYFINMKRKLLVQEREIEDKIRLGEEQRQALQVSLAQLSPSYSSASSSLSPS